MKKTLKLILLAALIGSACLYSCKTKPPDAVKVMAVAEIHADTIKIDSISKAISENTADTINQKTKNDTVTTSKKSLETIPMDSINKLNQEPKIENIVMGQSYHFFDNHRECFDTDYTSIIQFTNGELQKVMVFAISPNGKKLLAGKVPNNGYLHLFNHDGNHIDSILFSGNQIAVVSNDGRIVVVHVKKYSDLHTFKAYDTNRNIIKSWWI